MLNIQTVSAEIPKNMNRTPITTTMVIITHAMALRIINATVIAIIMDMSGSIITAVYVTATDMMIEVLSAV